MSELTKKIIDILFEEESPLSDEETSDEVEIETKVPNKEKKIPSAKEILYGGESKSTAFIDYVSSSTTNRLEQEDETYEMRGNVSPIFGPIDVKEKKKKPVSQKEIKTAVNYDDNNSEYTGVVISPIYGYDNTKANNARKILQEPISYKVNNDEPFDYEEDIIEDANDKEESTMNDDLFEVSLEKHDDPILDDYNVELTQDDYNELLEKSLYDTTPIQLFDFDDDKNESMDDIFNDIVKEDK